MRKNKEFFKKIIIIYFILMNYYVDFLQVNQFKQKIQEKDTLYEVIILKIEKLLF